MFGKGVLGIGVFIIVLLLPGFARAEQQGPGPVSIDQAIEIALGGNIGLKTTTLSVESSKISLARSKAAFLPVLQGYLGSSLQIGKNAGGMYSTNPGWLSGNLSLGIGLDIVVFDGLANISLYRKAEHGLESSELSLTRTQQGVMFETIVAYLDLVMDQERLLVSQENVASQRKVLELVQARQEQGSALVADVLKQKAELESAKLALVQAESALKTDRIELAVVMGLKPGANVDVAFIEVNDSETGPVPPDVDIAITLALAERPDVLALAQNTDAAAQDVEAARAGYLPKVSLFLDLSTNWSSAMQSQNGFADQMFIENPGAATGVSISIPIFDAFSTKHDIEQAQVGVLVSELEMQSLEQQVEREIRLAWQEYEKATEQLEVATRTLEYASQSHAAYEELYALGGCTLVDLSQARTLELQASTDVIEARHQIVVDVVAIYYYVGDTDGMLDSVPR